MDEDFVIILEVAQYATEDEEMFESAKRIGIYLVDKIEKDLRKAQGGSIVLGLVLAALAIVQTKKLHGLH